MNIDVCILLGQPRGKRELVVIGTYPKRTDLLKARDKVKPKDFAFVGELSTNGDRLKDQQHLFIEEETQPEPPAE